MSTVLIGAETAKLAGLQIDLLQKLRTGQLTTDQLEWWLNRSANDRERIMSPDSTSPQPPAHPRPILLRLFEGEEITIEATDGRETMAGAKKTFPGYLDGDFKSWGTDKPGRATERQPVSIFEMREDATFAQMFGSLGDPRTLVLQQSQIIEFCRTHRNRLRSDGYATFFLFEVEGDKGPEVFVARVYVLGRKLEADVYRFGPSHVWSGDGRHRLVVPQLAAV